MGTTRALGGVVDGHGRLARGLAAVLALVVVLACAVLSWTAAHWLSVRLAEPHGALHAHGVEHHDAATAVELLAAAHGHLRPAAATAAVVLLVALAALRVLPATERRSTRPRVTAPVTAACSVALFWSVELAEQSVNGGPVPLVLLGVGALVHTVLGVAAAVAAPATVDLFRRTSPAQAVVAPVAVFWCCTWGGRLLVARLWLGAQAGRSPPTGSPALA